MNLDCSYHFLNPQQPEITVGEMFEAHCKINASASETASEKKVDLSKIKVKFEEGKNYDLVVVRSAENTEQINFALTSYVVGKKDFAQVVLSDDQQELVLQPSLQFEVKSILKPEEKTEMYGPMAGLNVAIPFFYWVILGAVLVALVSGLLALWRRRWKRKKLLQKLNGLENGTKPIQQFFTSYRRLQRENAIFNVRSEESETANSSIQSTDELLQIVNDVEQFLRLFVARTFAIDALELSWPKIRRQLEKFHPVVFEIQGQDLLEVSKEFIKAGTLSSTSSAKIKATLKPKDAILISEKTRKWIEKSDQLQAAILAKDTQQIRKMRGTVK